MDSAEFLLKCTTTAGQIDRLENLSSRIRDAYAAGDKRMFHRWAAEYGPLWQRAQDDCTELGQAALRDALNPSLQLGYSSPVDMHEELTDRLVVHTNSMNQFMASVNRSNPSFLIPASESSSAQPPKASSGGCYVATAVYGSYDCPELWVLRRFRDQRLARSFPGRAFIRSYYTVSPIVLRLMGQHGGGVFKGWIAALVRALRARGYSDEPYAD